MNEATQILLDAVAKLYTLCDAMLPVDHTAATRIESLGIAVEQIQKDAAKAARKALHAA